MRFVSEIIDKSQQLSFIDWRSSWRKIIMPMLWVVTLALFFYALWAHELYAQPTTPSDQTPSSQVSLSLSLEQLIMSMLHASSQIKALRSQVSIAKSEQQKQQGTYDPQLFSQLQLSQSKPDPFPSSRETDAAWQAQWESGLRRQWKSGTHLELAFATTKGESPTMQPLTDNNKQSFYGGELRANITQNLWKNAWGSKQRLEDNLAAQQVISTRYRTHDEIEAWMMKAVEAFFVMKRAQLREQSSYQRKIKNEKILQTARLLSQRGNIERADLYQIQVRTMRANEDYRDASLALQQNWQSAVEELGLDSAYTKINPSYVRLSFSALAMDTSKTCQTTHSWKKQAGYQHIEQQSQISNTKLELAQNSHRASLDLSLSLRMTGKEEKVTQAFQDTITAENGTWSIMLAYRRPLSYEIAKSDIWKTQIHLQEIDFQRQSFDSRRKVQWQQACSSLRRLYEKEQAYIRIVEYQAQAARLDRRQFEIGKKDFFQATEAEIAEITSRFERDVLKLEIEQEKWKLTHYSGKLPDLFDISL